jgi:hypothetical protein
MFYKHMHLLELDYIKNLIFPVYGWVLADPVRFPEPIILDVVKRGVVRSCWLNSNALAAYEANVSLQPVDQPPAEPRTVRRRITGKSPDQSATPAAVQHDLSPPAVDPEKRKRCPSAEDVGTPEPKRKMGRPRKSDASTPPPDDHCDQVDSKVGGCRRAGLSIVAKWALVKEFLELSADPTVTNANREMLRKKRRGYYSGLLHTCTRAHLQRAFREFRLQLSID